MGKKKTPYERNYKSYEPKPFECLNVANAKFEDINGMKRTDTQTRLYESMLISKAFITLTPKQQILYVYCKAQFYGKSKPKNEEEFKELGLYQDESMFYMNLRVVKLYGLYTDSTHSNFYKDMGKLIEHGLIQRVMSGKYKKKSIYKFSDGWKTWKEK
jgi:hypothetical protein